MFQVPYPPLFSLSARCIEDAKHLFIWKGDSFGELAFEGKGLSLLGIVSGNLLFMADSGNSPQVHCRS